MTTERPCITIHVLGAGKGESIIIHLPDDKWGVVDCYARSLADSESNPTMHFLRKQGVGELEFLCLTHPHADHYRGMSQLLEEFPIRFFWQFGGQSANHFKQMVSYVQHEGESEARSESIESADEFLRIFGLLAKKQRQKEIRQRLSRPTIQLYPVPFDPEAAFQIVGLAPSENQAGIYNSGLGKCFDEEGRFRPRLPYAHHNRISVALLIVHGRTRIILGGDVEEAGWRDVVTEMGPAHLTPHMVKVSHHGSKTGYCDGLWRQFADHGKPIAVITSFITRGLPKRGALDHIREHTSKILLTCMTALRESELPTGLTPGVFRSRLALLQKMGRLIDENGHACGRCTLVFDDQGQCVDMELEPPAVDLSSLAAHPGS